MPQQTQPPICSCEFSYGEDLEIHGATINQDLCKLAESLANNVLIPVSLKRGEEVGKTAIHRELKNIIIRLDECQKATLLHHFIYTLVVNYMGYKEGERRA